MKRGARNHAPAGWRFLVQTSDGDRKEARRLGKKVSGGKELLLVPGHYEPMSRHKLWKNWMFLESGFMIFVPDNKERGQGHAN